MQSQRYKLFQLPADSSMGHWEKRVKLGRCVRKGQGEVNSGVLVGGGESEYSITNSNKNKLTWTAVGQTTDHPSLF